MEAMSFETRLQAAACRGRREFEINLLKVALVDDAAVFFRRAHFVIERRSEIFFERFDEFWLYSRRCQNVSSGLY